MWVLEDPIYLNIFYAGTPPGVCPKPLNISQEGASDSRRDWFLEWLYGVVFMAWNSYPNCGHMWVKERTNTRYTHVNKLDFNALNDCFWVTWRSWDEKMFKSIRFLWKLFWHMEFLPQQSWSQLGLPNTTEQSHLFSLCLQKMEEWTMITIDRLTHSCNQLLEQETLPLDCCTQPTHTSIASWLWIGILGTWDHCQHHALEQCLQNKEEMNWHNTNSSIQGVG